MHYNCLIVDDEADLAKMTCEYFELFDVSCAYVTDADSCMEFLLKNQVDLLLLDINLSEESGFVLCKRLRENSDIPIFFISARESDEDVLIALNIGGDDYIKKPYTLSILLAKVKAVLKRIPSYAGEKRDNVMMKPEQDKEKAESGLYLDENVLSAYVFGRKVELKAKEFKLLQCLYENRNTIVTKERLFDEVWGDAFFSDGTLNVHIRRLREKLEENPNEPKLIRTVWGTGYILETEGDKK